jgi:hypothetical protein
LFGLRQPANHDRNLPSTGHAHERDVLGVGAVAREGVHGTFDQPVDNEVIEAAGHDGEASSGGDLQCAFHCSMGAH